MGKFKESPGNVQKERENSRLLQALIRADISALISHALKHVAFQCSRGGKKKHSHLVFIAVVIPLVCTFPERTESLIKVKINSDRPEP